MNPGPGRCIHKSRVTILLFRWGIPAIAILLAAAASGNPAGSGTTTSTGAQVTKSVPFAHESIDEIRALLPSRARTVPGDRAIPFRRIPRRTGSGLEEGPSSAGPSPAAPAVPSSPAPSAPALDSSFAGLGNPPHGEDVTPPDTMGAAGPNHLVSLLNSDFGVFSKTTGAVLQKISLQSFWGSLGTGAGEPANFPFDTKVIYDVSSGRFFAMTLGGTGGTDSWILVAVSASSNPTGQWSKWAIDADLDNNSQLFTNWADFPGFGMDAANVYVTANMFNDSNDFQYGKIWVLPKAQLLSGSSSITWTEFRNPPGSSYNMQPAHTFDAAAAEYILFEKSSSQLFMARIDTSSGAPVWNPPVTVSVAQFVSSSALPDAPQSGSANTIDTSDTRLLNVVYRSGSLWTVHTVQSPDAVKTEVAWYRIDPSTRSVLSGRISDPTRWYYYPSIAINKNGVAAVGFSGSSGIEYAGGYYTIIQPSSATAEPVTLLKQGEATYSKTLGGSENRWGDYSATVVDPVDDVTFWTLQEYAMTHDTFFDNSNNVVDRSRWGTWWGKFHPSDVRSPTGLIATVNNISQVTLHWADQTLNENGYVVERRVAAGGTFVVLTSPQLPQNTITYVDNVGLIAGTTYYYRIGAVGSTGTSYSVEVPVTIQGSPPSSGGGGGGGCLSIARSGGEPSSGSSLFAVGILLLPACALGLRRFFRRQGRSASARHPLC